MFNAYSFSKKQIVNINSEFDLHEEFGCPNRNCTAKFKIKSPSGKKAKHFAKLQSDPHIPHCPFDKENSINSQNANLKKSSLEDIYNQESGQKKREPKQTPSSKTKSSQNSYVRTPKQLYSYCANSDITDEYMPGIRVGDIILDERNIKNDGNFQGISGLRLLVGETIKYDNSSVSFKMKVSSPTKGGGSVNLFATIYLSKDELRRLRNYLYDTYGKFEKNQIAVFEKWSIDKQYYISSHLTSFKNIVKL